MADDKKGKDSILSHATNFYFAPELRSILTIFYFAIYGYFTLYYIDNIFIVIRFLFYIVLGHTALSGTAYLFTGMTFVISLALPFLVSFYSLFLLPSIWKKPQWSAYAKWAMTAALVIVSVLIIILSDETARLSARQPVMQSFVEDANLTGRI